MEAEMVSETTEAMEAQMNLRIMKEKWMHECCTNSKLALWFAQAIKLLKCNKTSVRDVEFVDSPQVDLAAFGCSGVGANNVSIRSPGDSPNTDGIHLHNT
ncbi:hypothetical protein Syun_011099 [Stephania yunnanensis]|uniref:Uncharacterized protein n=1 Tax=Stephania yunnanensis TaxID=152371 RepID=A0AAP0PG62_9MAGN